LKRISSGTYFSNIISATLVDYQVQIHLVFPGAYSAFIPSSVASPFSTNKVNLVAA
jgi:hypothetical protein